MHNKLNVALGSTQLYYNIVQCPTRKNIRFCFTMLVQWGQFKYFLIYYFQRKKINVVITIPLIAQKSWIQTLS